ncbi:MFS transporter [Scopulibacillus cellulosilyticus]|uniref:MFS transporter n=1 Tax=Scopulibacillus cellulosilyticus TaxID=2665665 RepID=A0ABW2Q2A5_9BACL
MKDHIFFLSAVFCFWFATYIYTPVFGVYLQKIGFSYSIIGIILGSYGITQIILRLPLGILSDLLQGLRKQLLIFGFFMALVSSLLLIYFHSFVPILAARLLAGVTASMWVMATILYSQYFNTNRASQAMGTMQFLTVSAQFISMAICGYLVNAFGWKFPFWVGAVASVIGIFFAWNIKEIKQNDSGQPLKLLHLIKATLSIPNLKIITFLCLIAHAVLFITIFGFSPIYAAHLGIDEKAFVWVTCAFFIPHACSSLSLVFIKINMTYNKWILGSCFCITAIFLIIVPYSKSLASLCLLHAIVGLALGFIFPLLLSQVVQISSGELKMSAMGFYQSFYALGIFLGPMIAGKIAGSIGLNDVFYFTGIISMIAAVLVVFRAVGIGYSKDVNN